MGHDFPEIGPMMVPDWSLVIGHWSLVIAYSITYYLYDYLYDHLYYYQYGVTTHVPAGDFLASKIALFKTDGMFL